MSRASTEAIPMTEVDAAPISEKIVKRKTVVYQTLVDPTVVKVTSENLKDELFARFMFFKPKPEDIQFVSLEKYYEPYIMISGRYFIDYYRKCAYTVNVAKEVLEVILLKHSFEPTQKDRKAIKLEGEERLVKEITASLSLNRSGQEVSLDKLPSAPSEKHPKKTLKKFGAEEISQDFDLDIIRSKIVRRPKDINRIVDEIFEIKERVVIYTPRFRILFKNVETGEEKAIEFDGVTSKRIR